MAQKPRTKPGRQKPPAGPVVIKRRDKPEGPEEQILVFSIQDDAGTADYYMPGRIPAGLALQALDQMQGMGEAAGAAWLLREVLGDDAYEALSEDPDLEPDQLKQITAMVTQHVLGQMEPSGKS